MDIEIIAVEGRDFPKIPKEKHEEFEEQFVQEIRNRLGLKIEDIIQVDFRFKKTPEKTNSNGRLLGECDRCGFEGTWASVFYIPHIEENLCVPCCEKARVNQEFK